MRNNNILVIAPHMDDEVLGCGGAICKHINNGDRVYVIFIAHRIYNHVFDDRCADRQRVCALEAKKILKYQNVSFLNLPDERLDIAIQDIIIPLEKQVNEIKPAVVYIPFRSDNNQDHRAVFDASRVVLRPVAAPFIKYINMYEIPSSTEQSPALPENAFLPNFYINIKSYIDRRMNAYRCYKTEKRPFPHPRSEKALINLAQKRGIEIGFEYAEAFINIRGKWL